MLPSRFQPEIPYEQPRRKAGKTSNNFYRLYDAACAKAAAENGLVFWDYDNDCIQSGSGLAYISLITAYLEYRPSRLDSRILCTDMTDANLPSVLSYLKDNSITARAPNEVDPPEYE